MRKSARSIGNMEEGERDAIVLCWMYQSLLLWVRKNGELDGLILIGSDKVEFNVCRLST
jgi:hypothetical protein